MLLAQRQTLLRMLPAFDYGFPHREWFSVPPTVFRGFRPLASVPPALTSNLTCRLTTYADPVSPIQTLTGARRSAIRGFMKSSRV